MLWLLATQAGNWTKRWQCDLYFSTDELRQYALHPCSAAVCSCMHECLLCAGVAAQYSLCVRLCAAAAFYCNCKHSIFPLCPCCPQGLLLHLLSDVADAMCYLHGKGIM